MLALSKEPKFIGVEMDDKGNIITDEYQNTSAPKVYAVGDVTGKWLLTPGETHFHP